MARTVNPTAYAARRDAFVDAAIRLVREKGYERLSIQDVIEEVGASKGAFQHYFDSKAALLAAIVEDTVEASTAAVAPIARDPQLTPLQKLQGVFAGIYQWKTARPQFDPEAVAESARTWFSDENTIVVARMRAAVATRLTPVLVDILREGAADGSFSITDPDGTATVLTSLMLDLNDVAIQLFLARRARTVSFDTVKHTLASYAEASERILGLPPGTWPLVDEQGLRFWFDSPL